MDARYARGGLGSGGLGADLGGGLTGRGPSSSRRQQAEDEEELAAALEEAMRLSQVEEEERQFQAALAASMGRR